MPTDDDTRVYDQINRRLDDMSGQITRGLADVTTRIDTETATTREFRSETRNKLHRLKGSVGTTAEQAAQNFRDINALTETVKTNKTDSQSRDEQIAHDMKEALGPEGWVTKRLDKQDAKWTRIYFLIISLLLSVITLTVTLWLGALGGKTP